jgi:DNA-binding NarL/FixJ family response regulator
MAKKIILVGHCGPDSSYLRMAVSGASKDVAIAHAHDDASLDKLIDDGADLVLLNRQLEYGFSTEEGVAMIERLREKYPQVKMMLVSNYPEAQEAAVKAGALLGFGKSQIGTPRVAELIRQALS